MSAGMEVLAQQRMIEQVRKIEHAIAMMQQITRGIAPAEVLLGGGTLELHRAFVDPDTMFLTCPDCGADDSIMAVEWNYAEHRMSTFSVRDKKLMFSAGDRPGEETVAYQCGQCGTFVALPEEWTEEWA